MAFGFGFNKQKVLSAAEKCVQQGKLQNAIAEYEKVLKADPKDLTVMNTVGDLRARLGENEKAAECFKSVGDAYASQGFTVKAIAMYKKLSKLKTSTECVLRLAELYTQQGLFNDARAQYLQVAEEFLRSGQLDQAVRIFEKTLEMDPDNVAMRTRLAEVYIRIGKKPEAWQILTAAAESLRAKGQLAAADEILERMLKLEPDSSYALVLRGRAALDGGDAKAAIESLSKVADLDTNPEGLRALFQAQLKAGNFAEAGALAAKLTHVHNDSVAIAEFADALIEGQQYQDALAVYTQYSDDLLRINREKFVANLRPMIGHVQNDPAALEVLLALFQKAGENAHLTEVYELLAHAYVQSDDLEKAREVYLKLMQLEPANQMHAKNYQQVLEKQGSSSAAHLITSEEGAVLVEELEATAPVIDQRYDDEVAQAVHAALTDAELFVSYNMPGKALAPLLSALPKAPRDLRLNQKLLSLHNRAGRFAEAGVCCRTLESVYGDAGHGEEAARYAALAAKYEERGAAASKSEELPVTAPEVPSSASEFEIPAPAGESSTQEVPATPEIPIAAAAATATAGRSGLFFHGPSPTVAASAPAASVAPELSSPEPSADADLSSEWEQEFSVEAPLPDAVEPAIAAETVPPVEPASVEVPLSEAAASNIGESVEEVRFYLGQGMIEQAEQALAKAEAIAPESQELAVLRVGIESAKQSIAAAPAAPDFSIEEPPAAEPEPGTASAPEQAVAAAPQPWPDRRPVLQEIVSEIEESLGGDFTPPAASKPEAELSPGAAHSIGANSLDEFVSDLEASLGSDFPVAEDSAAAPTQAYAPRAAAAAAAAAGTSRPSSIPNVHLAASPAQSSAISTTDNAVAGVDLASMFGELKHDLEEDTAVASEDPETHYNLGVAFREMGLLDEAIGEFQKVCKAAERGHAFPQLMQTYTWLAQCFLDKGLPEAAIRWYEKALRLPSLDEETRTALHYELGASFESAGNNPAALKNFMEVYGSNIDYRDVAERIKALRP